MAPAMADTWAALILILVTLFVPPAGVFFIGGCSLDLLINVLLTILGFLPGHVHAFYCLWVYYEARSKGREGRLISSRPPAIFSKRILNGGEKTSYYNPSRAPTNQPYGADVPGTPNMRADVYPSTVPLR